MTPLASPSVSVFMVHATHLSVLLLYFPDSACVLISNSTEFVIFNTSFLVRPTLHTNIRNSEILQCFSFLCMWISVAGPKMIINH